MGLLGDKNTAIINGEGLIRLLLDEVNNVGVNLRDVRFEVTAIEKEGESTELNIKVITTEKELDDVTLYTGRTVTDIIIKSTAHPHNICEEREKRKFY